MAKEFTTMSVSNETYSRLFGLKITEKDSMDTVVKRLLDIGTKGYDPAAIVVDTKERILLRKTKKDLNKAKLDSSIIMKDIENVKKGVDNIEKEIKNILDTNLKIKSNFESFVAYIESVKEEIK